MQSIPTTVNELLNFAKKKYFALPFNFQYVREETVYVNFDFSMC